MIRWTEPSPDELESLTSGLRQAELTYQSSPILRGPAPPGYAVDHNRVELGVGEACFERAVAAVKSWTMFELGWVRAGRRDYPIVEGEVVAVIARSLGLWTVNCSRILEVIDEDDAQGRRFGFVYGTLPVHVEQGEERFLVEYQRGSESVSYDILAYSRPRHWLVRLGFFYTRYCQRCFGRDSKRAMRQTVSAGL